MKLVKSSFGTVNGKETCLYTVSDPKTGFEVAVTDFGATLVRVKTPDNSGKVADINFGQNSAQEFTTGGGYLGAMVGRVANRIANAKFTLEGKRYSLFVNNADLHSLHGGKEGFNVKLWKCTETNATTKPDQAVITFEYVSPDGEENYPGTLKVKCIYTIKPLELGWEFHAITDKTTIINLTNHGYWNLDGVDAGTLINNQQIKLKATQYSLVDNNCLATGEEKPTTGSQADWNKLKAFSQIFSGFGDVDNNFFIEGADKKKKPKDLIEFGEIYSPKTGRSMVVATSEPCVQIYTSNFMMNASSFGKQCQKHQAVCLETQRPPNAINNPKYAGLVTLKPGETYYHKTVHKFSVK